MYTTQAELAERIGAQELLRLLDRDGEGEADAGVVEGAIGEASALIDGYLKARYRLPLSPVPALLRPLAADLVLYGLHPWGAPEELRLRYRDAIRMLEAIAAGTILLDVEGAEPPRATSDQVRVAAPEPVFTREQRERFLS